MNAAIKIYAGIKANNNFNKNKKRKEKVIEIEKQADDSHFDCISIDIITLLKI